MVVLFQSRVLTTTNLPILRFCRLERMFTLKEVLLFSSWMSMLSSGCTPGCCLVIDLLIISSVSVTMSSRRPFKPDSVFDESLNLAPLKSTCVGWLWLVWLIGWPFATVVTVGLPYRTEPTTPWTFHQANRRITWTSARITTSQHTPALGWPQTFLCYTDSTTIGLLDTPISARHSN